MEPRLQEQLGGKYELLEKLGQGGMGAVYKARHRLLDQLRVIKVMHSRLDERAEFSARFRREARVAAELSHPNIATLHDFAVDDQGSAYIVMEFIPGITLRQLLHQPGGTRPALVLDIAQQALSALGYLHRKGFVHRDVAPDNLMLTDWESSPRVTLIDLGIAKDLSEAKESELTSAGTFLGKIRYASPEQFGAKEGAGKPDQRSDLYSFGVVLYELATGRYPIVGDSSPALMAGHLYQAPLPFEQTDPRGRVPEGLRRAVLKALEKDPADRFQNAEEFAQALHSLEVGLLDGASAAGEATVAFEAIESRGPQSFQAAVPALTEELAPTRVTGGEALAHSPTVATQAHAPAPSVSGTPVEGSPRLPPMAAVTNEGEAGAEVPSRSRPWAFWSLVAAAVVTLVLATGVLRIGALPFTGWARSADAVPKELRALPWGDYYALVIGNNEYRNPGLSPLQTAAGDANSLGDLLEERYGFEVERLIDADRREIIQALESYIGRMGEEDNLLVYYAGHGNVDTASGRGYWQPVDAEVANPANWISSAEVADLLLEIPARRVILIADSCFAGSLKDSWSEQPTAIEGTDVDTVRERLGRRSRLVLTSGNLLPVVDQGAGGHSIFSRALLEALDDNSEVLGSGSLFEQIEPLVVRISEQQGTPQEPQFAALESDEEGGFFFVPGR